MHMLLIHPPLGSIVQSYLSTGQLLGWLRQCSISAEQWDLNIEVANAALQQPRLARAEAAMRARMAALESLPELLPSQALEYGFYARLAPYSAELVEGIDELCAAVRRPDPAPELTKQLAHAFSLASCTYYQASREHFDLAHPAAPAYSSIYNPCSAADLMASAEDDQSLLSELYAELLPARLEASQPSIVGISVVFGDQIIPALKLACALKKLRPECFVVLGGPSISCQFRDIREPALFRYFDMLVYGEGELPLQHLARCFGEGDGRLDQVPNSAFLAGGVIQQGPQQRIKQAASPCYDGIEAADYFISSERIWQPYRLAQGCYWEKCTFCEYSDDPDHLYVESALEQIVADLREAVVERGQRRFHFVDAALPPKLLKQLALRLIREDLAIHWHGNVRLERFLTEPLCRLLARAGCVQIESGVETACDRLLKLIKKGATVGLMETAIGNLRRAGIFVHTYLIIGLPTETMEEATQTYRWVESQMRSGGIRTVAWHKFFITPGSHIQTHPQDYGITAVRSVERLDMQVESWDFDAPGMTREEAASFVKECARRTRERVWEQKDPSPAPEGRKLLESQLLLPPEIAIDRPAFDPDQLAELETAVGGWDGDLAWSAYQADLDARLPKLARAPCMRLTNLRTGASRVVSELGWSALQRAHRAANLGEVSFELAVETGRSSAELAAELARLLRSLQEEPPLGVLLV